ncbi:GAF domain-containing protein [Salinibius halmophilus]|uniref:GAF domain-containing protein n=1 Tax=Salinibius halmophilus TaxID=1853216 RepID=UPI001F1F321D|nr:GAF domain-containing protein [Salinibius halmophilus]
MFSITDSHLGEQASHLVAGETNKIANLSNLAALLMHSIKGLNWAGFYLVDAPEELVLGPFQGLPACIRIPFAKGVCGAAARLQQTQLVGDVLRFEGHIACDVNTRSELVVPIVVAGSTVAVIDLDSPHTGHFTNEHAEQVEAVAQLVAQHWLNWH